MVSNFSGRSFIGILAIFILGWTVGHWYYAPVKFEEIKESPVWITAVQHEYSYINRVSKSMDKNIGEEVEQLDNKMDRKENLDEFLANVLSIWELELDIAGDPYIAFAMAVNDMEKDMEKRVLANKKAQEDTLEMDDGKTDHEENDANSDMENNIVLKNRRVKIIGKKIYILLDSESMCKDYISVFKPYMKSAQYKEIFE